jgi:hypothetical protein
MKKIVYLALVFSLTVSQAFSQENRINLSLENLHIKDVLSRIEAASSYSFFYRDEDLDLTRTYNNEFTDATVIEIVRIYHQYHHHSDTYEFTGEFKDEHESQPASIRSRMYYRYTQRILAPCWIASLEGNKVTIKKTKPQS